MSRWTKHEEQTLRARWGTLNISTLARILRRTPDAVTQKAKRMSLVNRALTLREFARSENVPTSKVYWAMEQRELHITRVYSVRNKRLSNRMFLTPEQQDSLASLIRAHPRGRILRLDSKKTPKGMWGVGIKPSCCEECKTIERPHFAKGRCKRCYVRLYKWMQSARRGTPRGQPPKSFFATI